MWKSSLFEKWEALNWFLTWVIRDVRKKKRKEKRWSYQLKSGWTMWRKKGGRGEKTKEEKRKREEDSRSFSYWVPKNLFNIVGDVLALLGKTWRTRGWGGKFVSSRLSAQAHVLSIFPRTPSDAGKATPPFRFELTWWIHWLRVEPPTILLMHTNYILRSPQYTFFHDSSRSHTIANINVCGNFYFALSWHTSHVVFNRREMSVFVSLVSFFLVRKYCSFTNMLELREIIWMSTR